MAKIHFTVPHKIGKDAAVARLKKFSDKVRETLPPGVTTIDEQWTEDGALDFSLKGMGMEITGSVTTTEHEIEVHGFLPFAALPFRGAIESQLRDGVNEALDQQA